jgi:hypothetical protein
VPEWRIPVPTRVHINPDVFATDETVAATPPVLMNETCATMIAFAVRVMLFEVAVDALSVVVTFESRFVTVIAMT